MKSVNVSVKCAAIYARVSSDGKSNRTLSTFKEALRERVREEGRTLDEGWIGRVRFVPDLKRSCQGLQGPMVRAAVLRQRTDSRVVKGKRVK